MMVARMRALRFDAVRMTGRYGVGVDEMWSCAAGGHQIGEAGKLAVGRVAGHDDRRGANTARIEDGRDFAVARHRRRDGAATCLLVVHGVGVILRDKRKGYKG